MDLNPDLQGYVVLDYEAHYAEEDLVQEEPRILGEYFFPSTINSLVNSVSDFKYDPTFYMVDEGLSRPIVLYPKDGDCIIMFMDLVPSIDLWEVDQIVDVVVGAEVWAVNRFLVDSGLCDVPFVANLALIVEEAAVHDLGFWDSLLMQDLACDLGLYREVPIAALVNDRGKRKLGQVPADLWDVYEDPQIVPSSGNVHNVTRSG
ncbi:hypothetical protein RHMOL_Rhmol06G0118300 [Rhododendron molle]|uniref:Uncharacterized protein n=1 Tax=Rhododendron molle TaxID=49168 RepID=A0ACC0NCH0_RHOML|nr:hypothetical protein RHMOL_Rhmol06G0118300 [Rhododendron molle]